MENYKIKRNPKKLSDEEINRHKDFSKLLTDHKKLYRGNEAVKPLYKNKGFMSLMIVISVVLLVLVLDRPEEKPTKNSTDSLAVQKADSGMGSPIDDRKNNPLDNITSIKSSNTSGGDTVLNSANANAVAYEIFKVEPEKGAILYTKSGMRILVPSFAFFDKNKNVTKKEITLRFRELKNGSELVTDKTVIPDLTYELKADDEVTLTQALILEVTNPIREGKGLVYKYSPNKEKWEQEENEKFNYHFKIKPNETEYPALSYLKELVWELPEAAGKPSDFNYVFNRGWKNFFFTTSGKPIMTIKNTGTAYKIQAIPAPLFGTKKENEKLIEAFYTLYNFDSGKIKNNELRKVALLLIETWRNSAEGKKYLEWAKNKTADDQFSSTQKTTKLSLQSFGYIGIVYANNKLVVAKSSPRTLVLEQYPERSQNYINENEH